MDALNISTHRLRGDGRCRAEHAPSSVLGRCPSSGRARTESLDLDSWLGTHSDFLETATR
jgi:hypothetical protein